MKEQLIEFETAKLAKEKGFDEITDNYFTKKVGMNLTCKKYNDNKFDVNEFAAPNQSRLKKWLKEKHNIIATLSEKGLFEALKLIK